MIFVVRHAERADQVYNSTSLNIELRYDPPITKLGKDQSRVTGSTIKSLVQESHKKGLIKTSNPQYVIVSSPFFRCLQTSYHLIEGLSTESVYENTIFYEEGLSEFLQEDHFDDDTLKNLYIRQKTAEKINKHIPYKIREGIVGENKHLVIPKYPENLHRGYDRIEACYSQLVDYFMKELNSEGDKVLIMVTHAFGVQSILRIHLPLFFNDSGIEYATFNQIMYDEKERGKGKVLLKLHTKHVYAESARPKL